MLGLLFGGTSDGVDPRALARMKRLATGFDAELKKALAVEMANRYLTSERRLLVGLFVAACWMRMAPRDDRLAATVEAFREHVARWTIEEWAMQRAAAGRDAAALALDCRRACAARRGVYEEALTADLERAAVMQDGPVRLSDLSAAAALEVFPEAIDQERGRKMLLARLHGFFRTLAWSLQHPDD